MAETTAETKTLGYAALPEQLGVTIDRSHGGVRVMVPPVYNLRTLPKGYWISTAILCALPIMETITVVGAGAGRVIELIPVYIQIVLALLIIWWVAAVRLCVRVLFAAQGGRLAITRLSGRSPGRRQSWMCSDVEEVRYSPKARKLMIRFRGQDPISIFVSPQQPIGELVADTITAAIRDGSINEPTDSMHEDEQEQRQHRWNRNVCLTIALGLAASAVVLMIVFPVAMPASFCLLMAAAIPAGIALGTQDKKFWM